MKVYYVNLSGNRISVNVELLNANIRDERDLMSVFEIEDKILE
jgi:hypothetical protein